MNPVRNLVYLLAYDGTDFNGWQTQPGYRTVQETLETATATMTGGTRVRLNASGRTDAGVHAVGQVANFLTTAPYPCDAFLRAVNTRLPADVVVHRVWEAALPFDANKDAKRKLYRYVIRNAPTADPFLRKYSHHVKKKLDAAAMHRAAQHLRGRHDFHSFETEWPNRLSSVRTITHIAVNRFGDYLWLDVEADGFLYNMVRAIAGTLIEVGRGQLTESQVGEILRAEDRSKAGDTAPAEGLFLIRVTYE
ncbi:MAG: tRNA pseudouridine(38-40) synthase TruA [Gemmataceae bacterium]|nr:tRNA pseudouridine(38-40) synthase TruA [Gemmataceae bacterium]